jgi:hypothetical protein
MPDSAAVIKEAVEAFNKGNAEGLGGLFATRLQKGAAASVKTARTAASDLQYKIDHIQADGDHVAFSYTVSGTFRGKAARWTGSGTATVVNGKITALNHVEDLIGKGIQIGIKLNPTMTGNWAGSAQGVNVTLALSQSGNNVSGTASAFGATFPVSGTNNYPNVALHGNMNGVQVNFAGAFNPPPNTIPGTLTAMGSSLQVTITRQQ